MENDYKLKFINIKHLKIYNSFKTLNKQLINEGLSVDILERQCLQLQKRLQQKQQRISTSLVIILITVILGVLITQFTQMHVIDFMVKYALGTRCFIPNNYLIWEATRPVSNCDFCINITKALILPNLTREEFAPYAYSSRPIIIKNAVQHWPAMTVFTYEFFKNLYANIEGAYESVDDGCQFLHFQSDFVTIRDVFQMSEARAKNLPGEKSWYIGLGNCHPEVLNEMRKYYPRPHFLPDDAEISNREYIFFGYNDGATMHLDYIPRLMWQAQISGNKTWNLIPTPECENVCNHIKFYVEAGDAILLDTRVWYHSTSINTPGVFSLTVQSEYG